MCYKARTSSRATDRDGYAATLVDGSWSIWGYPAWRKRLTVAMGFGVGGSISEAPSRAFQAEDVPDLQHVALGPIAILCGKCVHVPHALSNEGRDCFGMDRPIGLSEHRVDNPIHCSRRSRLIFGCFRAGVAERGIVVCSKLGFCSETLEQGALRRRELYNLSRGFGPKPGVLPEAHAQERNGRQAQDRGRYRQKTHSPKLCNFTSAA